ncbi:hypothetical protein A1O3_09389 [Capronia epimyces CBS 606.96]|uniref:Methyltransferase n=1 Tax=Capronia epimyces CBS 606.96 TaxID=1182542 RepID=W9XDD0_9EURO|nr:uncharacterized protein A1O3_09389 [Capronia epimyces CBS 606.96]EXJ78228.1 hypothetical protein A1O3_09389 [Capronia epimyces CBS 606.96]
MSASNSTTDEAGVRGEVQYLDKSPLYETEKPFECTIEPWHFPGARQNNLSCTAYQVLFHDISASKEKFSLDVHGFQVETHISALVYDDFWSDDLVQNLYYPECEEFFKTHLGADEVYIFDHVPKLTARQVRKADAVVEIAGVNEFQRLLKPSIRVHVDQTTESAIRRVKDVVPDRAESLLARRFRIIKYVTRPAANLDALLTSSDLVSQHFLGEQYYLRYSPRHRWWYQKDMTHQQLLAIKCFDSNAVKPDSRVARFAPHASFMTDDNGNDDGALPIPTRPRESIEIRALVFSAD